MTNSSGAGESRLDQIEAILRSTAERTAENAIAIQQNTAAILENRQQLQRTMLAVERLANAQMELARAFDEDRQRFEQTQASNNAALERIDRIMDYLMRRDGERGSEG
ncbi:MAG: hypothetical protein HC840_26580 [Leptolyngbyaceae cyanobacterium RM2_2_4]|nr:hypothetical protein [Leptolyngbyaceae cyanobacterium SM1_4_3]NJN89441.1 hypothetical protein [Leptolyngbyaceae cyanobacterium SL_5_14]NJO52371.1 hypothetical protein [Leptolyngbyaceae cyanobacterium RM2_2_4]NJO67296.1 hypothetical protein [Leptolyngbyaceae cyanobacterium RM1_405_57]